jgi:LuxR family maltose regulon positive regulatory protein
MTTSTAPPGSRAFCNKMGMVPGTIPFTTQSLNGNRMPPPKEERRVDHSSLLSTKLYAPTPRPDLVERTRLLDLLNDHWLADGSFGRRLTLVAAPAGYGKSTVTCQWLENADIPVGWLSLDADDNDPVRFATYLLAALRMVRPGLGTEAAGLLASPQGPNLKVLTTVLINELRTQAEPVVLVLDDYHLIQTASIHQQMALILDHQPANFHVVINTREDPPLPIARLRARGQVLEVRQQILRFTSDETTEFLNRVMAVSLSPEETEALERRTEGWIAGLQLAALSMRGRKDISGFIRAFTGSTRFILDFLMEEVFNQQRPSVQDYLLKTSVLERLSRPLCQAVIADPEGANWLDLLDSMNLFVVPLDQSREWYRYHRLFAELLRHRLRLTHPSLEPELHARASAWFEKHGMLAEAIHHALSAEDWTEAAALIQAASTEYLHRGEVFIVLRWYQSLPDSILSADPKLALDLCWALLLGSEYEAAKARLTKLELGAGGPPALLGEIYAAQAYLARSQGDHQSMIERSRLAMKTLPDSAVETRGIVAMNLGIAYWHMGEMEQAEEVLDEGLRAAQTTGNLYARVTCLIFLGRVAAVRADLGRSKEWLEEAVRHGGDIPINALAHLDLAALNYEWNDLAAAESHLERALKLSRQSQNDEFLAGSLLLGSRLMLALGDHQRSDRMLAESQGLVDEHKVSMAMANRLRTAIVYSRLQQGQPVARWTERLDDHSDCHPYYRFLGVTKARALPRDRALQDLFELDCLAQEHGWTYGRIAVQAQTAAYATAVRDKQQALGIALQLAEPAGLVRAFVEVGEDLVSVLQAAAERGVSPEYVSRILTAFDDRPLVDVRAQIDLVEPLTDRELEVLRLVADGMSNREIAEVLYITSGTVKTHVHNMCGKLGARNRTEAALKGRDLGLL